MTLPEVAAVGGFVIIAIRFIQEIPTRREQREIKKDVGSTLQRADDAAVAAADAKRAAEGLKKDVADNTKISTEARDQAKLTNGRVTALEVWKQEVVTPALAKRTPARRK